MKYKTYQPPAQLAGYIRCYWILEGNKGGRDRVFPDGCIELIFHYGDLFKKYIPKGKGHLQPRCFIHGQLRKYMELEPTGRVGVFSVRFNPGGLQAFVKFDVSKITGKTITVEKAWPGQGEALAETIINAANTRQRIKRVETFLKQQLHQLNTSALMVESCVNRIIQSHGSIPADDLARHERVGQRYLERKFNAMVGLSPKLLSRIIRFNHALQLIEKKDFRSFTAVAHEGGFYDQAHFIKDFKNITGLNPKKYFAGNLEMVKFFNL